MANDDEAVAWRVKDYADGWMLCYTEKEAKAQSQNGNLVQPLYLHPSNSGVAVTEEMVERGHRAQMSELFLRCQPDRGDVFGFMDDRKDVMRIALVAAFSTSPKANKNEGE